MSLLIFSFRRQHNIDLKARINLRLMQLRQKQMDLQTYAANVAEGAVTLNGLLTTPSALFPRMMQFMQYSNAYAYQAAQQKFAVMGMMGAFSQLGQLPPQQQQAYQSIMIQQLAKQEQETISRSEQKRLNVEDKKIEQEIARLETQLKMLEAEDQGIDKAEEKGIQSSTPKFGATG